MPEPFDISIVKGTAFNLSINIDIQIPPVPADLTGYVFEMAIKNSIRDPLDILRLIIGSGLTVTGNNLKIELTSAQVAILPDHSIYDLSMTPPAGNRQILLNGCVKTARSVTHG
jgi:hypothetical protein